MKKDKNERQRIFSTDTQVLVCIHPLSPGFISMLLFYQTLPSLILKFFFLYLYFYNVNFYCLLMRFYNWEVCRSFRLTETMRTNEWKVKNNSSHLDRSVAWIRQFIRHLEDETPLPCYQSSSIEIELHCAGESEKESRTEIETDRER